MSVWEVCGDSELGLQCRGTPYCNFCKTAMGLIRAKPHTFLLDADEEEKRSYAIDVEMQCPWCGFWDVFGVAITKEHFFRVIEKIRTLRQGTW